MKHFATAALAVLMVATACNKTGIATQTQTTICAETGEIGSKAHQVHKYDMLWSAGDKIHVSSAGSSDTFTLKSGEGTTRGIFVQDGSKAISGEVEAVFPSSIADKDGVLTWPATQGSEMFMPMYSRGTIEEGKETKLGFSALGSVLQIVFTTTHKKAILKTIEIQDEEKPLSGEFKVNEDGCAVILSEGNQGVTVDFGDGVAVGMTPEIFNIALPAGQYGKLTLTFRTTADATCTMVSTTMPKLQQNAVARIAVCAQDFKTDRLYVGAPLWADKNIGAEHPYDRGYYFSWGNVTPYVVIGSYMEESIKYWIWANALDTSQTLSGGFTWKIYDATPGAGLRENIPANETYDAARNMLGGKWRVPSIDEMLALSDSCYLAFTADYQGSGVRGCIIYKAKAKEDKGKRTYEGEAPLPGYSSSDTHIFLPCASHEEGNRAYSDNPDDGRYWTSTNVPNVDFARRLRFSNDEKGFGKYIDEYRWNGCVIRPVSD